MRLAFTVCCLMITFLATAQYAGSIKGTVTDAGMNQEPILFAHVQIKNSRNAIETNFHGNYEFSTVAPGDYTLIISYLGYETAEVPIVVAENGVTKVNTSLDVLLPSYGDFESEDDKVLKETNTGTSPVTGELPTK